MLLFNSCAKFTYSLDHICFVTLSGTQCVSGTAADKKCSFFEVLHQVLTCDLLYCIVDGVKYNLVSVGGGRVCLC